MREVYLTFEEIQAAIEVLQEDADHETERFEVEERYIETSVTTDKWLTESQPPTPNVAAAASCCTPALSSTGLQVNLPKADLPNFSGKFEEWLSFKDKFTSMIDSQDAFSKVQKFHYLRSALSGEAAKVIAAMETTEQNYSKAWQLLQDTYANEGLIIARHTDLLVETPSVEQETAAGLRDFVSHVLQHLRSLTTLNVPVEHWDHLLMSILLPKLAQQTRMAYDSTLKDKETPKISGLMEFLRQRSRRLETTATSRTNTQTSRASPRVSPTPQRRQTKRIPNISSRKDSKVFVTTTPLKNCALCKDKAHTIHRCEEFHALSVSERINAARKEKLCFKCLRTGHSTQECTSSQCRICNLGHNTLLHLPRSGRRSPTPPKKQGSTTAAAVTSAT
ncbi:hypothetical protein WH47_09231 [Habropoda laboriosa]|uniref:CCHC-type domain-containing protein n=1 Tax=Habropoda laboriosa TaxID=597456 RepID=A0A0L7QJG5_9HYME|nr:hypothetical protein WH47_09231 [Habropoda laboriosa]